MAACTNYGIGTVSGDTNTYASATSVDPNKHVSISYSDALGRTFYAQFDSGLYGGSLTLNEQKTMQYNVLNEPTSVVVADKATQSGQTITSVTTTAQYDDLGRLTQVADPDRGTHTYTLDANEQVLTDTDSTGKRIIGYNYDLLGRLGCVQDAIPTINASGACSAGNIYVQNTYDTSKLTVSGTTDYPKGHLTQSVSTTYLTGVVGGDSVTTTESYEHDARGRLAAAQMQFGTLPSSWGITTSLPSYLAQYSFNDADQATTTTTTRSSFSHLGTASTQTAEVVHTNQKHPFLTLEQGFVSVSKITLGMHLLRADDSFGVVTGWKTVPSTQVMYNLEVAQDHTSTVGDGQWVVHNCGPSFPEDPSQLGHIFTSARGHFSQDTPENRQSIMDTINDNNKLGTGFDGNDWYARTLPDGSQVWVLVRDNVIQNGGLNPIARIWDPIRGRLVLPTAP